MERQSSQEAVVKAVQLAQASQAAKAVLQAAYPPMWVSQKDGELNTGEMTVLIVDDEPNIVEVVSAYLQKEHFNVLTASDGEAALQIATDHNPNLIVLDVMLPRLDGLEVCRRVRAGSNVPIIMLTARGEETDKLIGLGIGADDYMTKPFSPRELVARIKAILRRVAATVPPEPGAESVLRYSGLKINPKTRSVDTDKGSVDLTAKEFDLLLFLASHPSEVFTRTQLLDQVWDYSYYGDTSTVTVHIRRLREKIEPDPMRPRYIKTVWGVGYKFEK